MKKVITILLAGMATAALLAGGAGEYTANRMPGTNLLWTAGRTAEEISAASASNAAAIAAEAALRIDGTNALSAAASALSATLSASTQSIASIQSALPGIAAASNTAASALAAAAAATNTAAASAALSAAATNTAASAIALAVSATNAAAGANTLSAAATNTAWTALALGVIATNQSAQAAAAADIAYLYATNAAAQVAGVYTPATNAAAVSALAWSRANLAYTMAGTVYGYSTNAIDIATNAAAQVATAYPAATNALVQATNATAVSAAAHVLASNAWDTATNAYTVATNAQQRVGLLETNKADKAELANYETVQDANIVAALALDASMQVETAVKTNDVRWLAALTNETDAAALAALAAYRPSGLWEEAQASNTLMRIEGGTNLVFYSFSTVPVTNYSVTYSESFRYDDGEGDILYPPVTNAVTPNTVTNGWNYYTHVSGEYEYFYISATNYEVYSWQPALFATYPQSLLPASYGYGPTYGTATVSRAVLLVTNELYRLDIPALMNGDAITTEQDLAALRLYHYGSPDIIESPAEWFVFDGAGIITGINAESVTNWNIVIPGEICGVPVTGLGALSFSKNYEGTPVETLTAPRKLTVVGTQAFLNCDFLKSIIFRGELLNVNSQAFQNCLNLKSVSFSGNAPSVEYDIYDGLFSDQVTNYVMSATATGWGATLGGMPVVRLPLHTDALTLGGVTHTNWPSADVSGLATTNSPTILNPTVHGWLALPQTEPTNLVLRLVCSNEHIIVQEVYP